MIGWPHVGAWLFARLVIPPGLLLGFAVSLLHPACALLLLPVLVVVVAALDAEDWPA